jgi:hypothetical protein
MAEHCLSLDEFQDLLDRYGDRTVDWPDTLRPQAEALLACSPAARQSLAATADLRRRFAAEPPPVAPPGLLDRIVGKALHEE